VHESGISPILNVLHLTHGGDANVIGSCQTQQHPQPRQASSSPFLGVAPIIIGDVMAALQRLSDEGVALLSVEQNMHRAIELVARAWNDPVHEQEIGS
jgi:hypothetical protein